MRVWLVGILALVFANAATASETITYTYDANGRLVAAAHSGTVNNGMQTTYTLDKADNRTQVVSAAAGGSPDLTGTAGPTPSTATVGVATTVSAIVNNIGTGAAGASTTLFQFLDSSLNCTQPNFCGSTQSATGAVAANSSINVSTTYTFPVAGTYAVRFCADNSNAVAESNENNNCSPITYVTAAAAAQPNLTVTAGPTPSAATAGVPTTVQGVVRDVGSGNAGSSVTLFQFLDVNLNCTQPNFCGSANVSTGAISANSSTNVSTTYTFPVAGTYATRLCADINNNVAESNENDNCGPITYVTASVAGQPDLVVTSGPTPSSVTAGTPVTVQDLVTNSGNGSAGSSVTLFQFLDVNLNCTQPNFCGSANVSTAAISANSSTNVSTTYTFPVAGTYATRLCADINNNVSESNESNNCGPITYVTAH